MEQYINKVIQGNSLEKLKDLQDESIDAIVSDPPYELGFMGKKWDNTGIAYNVDLWKECLRVLKPGGHLLAFGGTRTYHRMAVAIEDAGFEVRDMLEWIYASGFPKSLNVGKAVDKLQGNEREDLGEHPTINGTGKKWRKNGAEIEYVKESPHLTKGNSEWEGFGTALKPAHEPIIMARKPLSDGGLDIAKTICYNIREKGLLTNQNVLWRIENVKNAGKQKTKLYSGTIQLPRMVETSAEVVKTNENDCVGKQIQKLQELMQKSGEKQTQFNIEKTAENLTEPTKSGLQNTQNDFNKNESSVSLMPMVGNASAVEKQAQSSSLLTISENGVEDTEKNSDTKISTLGSKSKDSQKKDLDYCAGTATLPTLNMEVVHIIKIEFENKEYEFAQLIDGSFVWNNNLSPFREPRPCTIVENVLKHGTGAIDIDGCRIPIDMSLKDPAYNPLYRYQNKDKYRQPSDNGQRTGEIIKFTNSLNPPSEQGRFPANIICTDDALNDGVMTKSGKMGPEHTRHTDGSKNGIYGKFDINHPLGKTPADSGSKSRYFDIDVWAEKHGLLQFPKASKRERNEGCEGLEEKGKVFNGQSANPSKEVKDVEARFNTQPTANYHPTVKPVHLMSWLVRLVSKEGDTVLDPFMGSGTTGVACKKLNRNFIGIELSEEYCKIAEARLSPTQSE